MPTYEVRRRTVLGSSVVTAANETEARFLARDVWQRDAAIAALSADVIRQPSFEPYDRAREDEIDFAPPDDCDSELERRWALGGAERPQEATEA